MEESKDLMPTVSEAVWAKTLGEEMLRYMKSRDPGAAKQIACAATKLREQIKAILDDDRTDDAECFRRIEKIVDAFHATGISTSRHDW